MSMGLELTQFLNQWSAGPSHRDLSVIQVLSLFTRGNESTLYLIQLFGVLRLVARAYLHQTQYLALLAVGFAYV